MTLSGACACNNLSVIWRTVDVSLVPRACQCDYCRGKQVAWVSKQGSAVKLTALKKALHRVVEQGGAGAQFHECLNCAAVVCVTAEIEGETYGAVNVRCLQRAGQFPQPVETDTSGLGAEEKRARWRANWCCPVQIS
ncbi:MAG: hypothetical protein Hals2KO_18030 [Halioglobus sp.]